MRARSLVSSILAVAVAVVAVAPGTVPRASADEPSDAAKTTAKQHYQSAEKSMQEGRYADAAAQFGAAYEAYPDPVLFYRIGFAHQSAGNCGAALVYYRRYLSEGKPKAEDVKTTEARIKECEGGAESGAATATGAAPATETAPESGTGTGTGTESGVAAEGEPSFLDEKASWQRSTGWILVGTTVALATAGTILAMSSQSREEDLDSLGDFRDPQGRPATYDGNVRERYEDLIAEGDRFNKLSTIAFGAAGVTLVASVTLLFLDSRRTSESGSAITLTPVLGRDTAGAAATLRF